MVLFLIPFRWLDRVEGNENDKAVDFDIIDHRVFHWISVVTYAHIV